MAFIEFRGEGGQPEIRMVGRTGSDNRQGQRQPGAEGDDSFDGLRFGGHAFHA